MAEVQPLSMLTAQYILMRLDATNLEILFKAATRMYRLSFKRYAFDHATQKHSILVEEGLIGTYKTEAELFEAQKTHMIYMNEHWWTNTPETIGDNKKDIEMSIDMNIKREYQTVDLDSITISKSYLEEELIYRREPLVR